MTKQFSAAGSLALALAAGFIGAGRQPAGAQSCALTVDHPTLTVGDQQGFSAVRATAASACSWEVTTSASWLAAFANKDPSTSTFVNVNIEANTTGIARQATVFLNGQAAVQITQGIEPCVSGFNPASIETTSAGAPRSTQLQTSTPDCAWFLGGFPIWASFPNPTGGVGPATVTFGFMPNLNGPARSTDLSFGGRLLHVTQAAPSCLFTATPTDVNMPANGGTGSFQLSGAGTDCTYTAVSQSDFVKLTSGATGTAPATIAFTVVPNVLPDNVWYITAANAFFRIHQNGAPIRTDGSRLSTTIALGPSGIRRSTGPRSIRITNIEQPAADYTLLPDRPWAIVTPSSGHTPAQLTFDIDPVQAAQLGSGFYRSDMKLTSSIAPTLFTFLSANLHVFGAGDTWQPFGVFETPRNGLTLSGAVPVTGWAVDEFGISRVSIYRDSVAGEPDGLVFIGDATRVAGARPDVLNRTNAPDTARAGWGYMLLSNVLPGGGNGPFTLSAYADNLDNTRVLLGRRTVSFANATATKPFGTIDVPAQGETVSGTIVNRGWVLTPAGKSIPIDGSTIKVYIDGVLLGPVGSYNVARPDVKAFFPGLANSDGPEARLSIDTTTLADGVHTIAWGVIDDAGVPEGIGSRYFTVQNGAASQVQARAARSRPAAAVNILPVLRTDVWSRGGVDDEGWVSRVATDADGRRIVHAAQGERIEIFLDPTLQAGCGSYEGHLVSGDAAAPLPPGSSLDARHGVFQWQPGIAFLGSYSFVFVQRGCDGVERRIPIDVTIAGR